MRFYSIALLLLAVLSTQATAYSSENPPNVVVSIKPLHSLVAGIMQGVGEPLLLMNSNQPIHHYSLKPSERRMLSKADLILWIGPGLESFMPRLLSSIDDKTRTIALLETKNLILHPIQGHNRNHLHTQVDPHIWLDTRNLNIMLDEITQQLIRIDPVHTTQYKKNNQRLSEKTIKLQQTLRGLLKGKTLPFITHHDSYQYLEEEFNLNNVGFISNSDDVRPGARHLQTLKQTINTDNIQCVFYNTPSKPPIVNSLILGTGAKIVELDPTGINTAKGENSVFTTLLTLGSAFNNCLSLNQ